jgi:soluble lytic murein transglycosylase-like protein
LNPAARLLLAVLLARAPLAAADPADPALRLALDQAVSRASSFRDRDSAQGWLMEMSARLEARLPDPFYRLELLRTIHHEATRRGLPPALVLALIETESGFDRHAVSVTGARGLMQVMPFWKKEIGHPSDSLFQPRTNLRYGCAILGHYMALEKGNARLALARYNGSAGSDEYPDRVLTALDQRWGKAAASRTRTVVARNTP